MATTAKFPKIICRVRALYAFSSTEKSSLSFEKGEYIEVLSQLDSGWWDGWCRGNRGWFPSNYVQIIDMNPEQNENIRPTGDISGRESPISPTPYPPRQTNHYDDDDSEEEARTISLIRSMNSGNNSNMNINSRPHSLALPIPPKSSERAVAAKINPQQKPRNHTYIQRDPTSSYQDQADDEQDPNLPNGWTLQIADDGLTKFYFNEQTGGLRWSHPGISDSDDEQYDSSGDDYDIQRHPYQVASATEHSKPYRHQLENFDDYNDFGKPAKVRESHHHRRDVFSTPPEEEPSQNINVKCN
jgi:hypothetical protein